MKRELIADPEASLSIIPGWKVQDGKLAREVKFDSYSRGVLFAVAVANIAETMDHHPDLKIGYQVVEIAVNTHDLGGISTVDFAFAERVNALLG
jgi:4a-hydroxytetrahydrobiopterin dehydratase